MRTREMKKEKKKERSRREMDLRRETADVIQHTLSQKSRCSEKPPTKPVTSRKYHSPEQINVHRQSENLF